MIRHLVTMALVAIVHITDHEFDECSETLVIRSLPEDSLCFRGE